MQIDQVRQCRACTPTRRSPSDIDVIVIHTPEGGESGTLSVLDGDRAGFDFYLPLGGTLYQCNDYLQFVAWQAGHWPTNLRSVGIEEGDFAANSGSFPEAHYDRLARLVAGLVSTTNTPLRRATSVGEPGIIAHRDVTPATRSDPGAHFRWDLLLQLVRQHLGGAPSPISPQLRQMLAEWRQARLANGENPNEYPAFRRHVLALGAPDCGSQEFAGFHLRTIEELEAEHPGIRRQLAEWQQARRQAGENPNDYAAFRVHLRGIHAPDCGENEFVGFRRSGSA